LSQAKKNFREDFWGSRYWEIKICNLKFYFIASLLSSVNKEWTAKVSAFCDKQPLMINSLGDIQYYTVRTVERPSQVVFLFLVLALSAKLHEDKRVWPLYHYLSYKL